MVGIKIAVSELHHSATFIFNVDFGAMKTGHQRLYCDVHGLLKVTYKLLIKATGKIAHIMAAANNINNQDFLDPL